MSARDKGMSAKGCTEHWEDAAHLSNGQKEYQKFKEEQKKSNGVHAPRDNEDEESHKKRGAGANQNGPSKKLKKGGNSKEPRGTAGDITRVPKKGQKVQWHSLPGYIDGEVVEVVYEEKTVEGKTAKGSKEDPRVVLRGASSGKIAVHKPEAVYFD